MVTEENDHSAVVTFRLNEAILNLLKENPATSALDSIKFWSDGCTSQFRSKFAFAFMMEFPENLLITWSFFEANHGKGPVDGVGGIVKHTVFREVCAGRVVITSPKHFAEVANALSKIHVIYIGLVDKDIDEEIRRVAKPVPRTLKVHFVARIESNLDFYETTSDEKPFFRLHFEEKVMQC